MTEEHPQNWSPSVDADAVDEALATVRSEAADHNAEYAAGMRLAASIVEDTLDC